MLQSGRYGGLVSHRRPPTNIHNDRNPHDMNTTKKVETCATKKTKKQKDSGLLTNNVRLHQHQRRCSLTQIDVLCSLPCSISALLQSELRPCDKWRPLSQIGESGCISVTSVPLSSSSSSLLRSGRNVRQKTCTETGPGQEGGIE